jgi:hypothetical protein
LRYKGAARLARGATTDRRCTVEILAALLGAAAGALLTWYVIRWQVSQEHRVSVYVHIDAFYRELLSLYVTHPQFGDAAKTHSYQSAFSHVDLVQYEFFAMMIHTFLETIFDHFRAPSGEIDSQWAKIFDFHGRLHLPWLLAAERPNEPEYVAYMRDRLGGRALRDR